MSETAVERRLRQLHDHIVKGLQRQPDDRVTAYCSPPDVTAIDAGREAIALLRQLLPDIQSGDVCLSAYCQCGTLNAVTEARALLARCEGE